MSALGLVTTGAVASECRGHPAFSLKLPTQTVESEDEIHNCRHTGTRTSSSIPLFRCVPGKQSIGIGIGKRTLSQATESNPADLSSEGIYWRLWKTREAGLEDGQEPGRISRQNHSPNAKPQNESSGTSDASWAPAAITSGPAALPGHLQILGPGRLCVPVLRPR